VDRPQRMTSPLVEDGFSGRQSHISRMNAVEYHRQIVSVKGWRNLEV